MGSFEITKEMLFAMASAFAPFLVAVVFLLAVLMIFAIVSSPTGDLRLDVIAMDIRERFNKKWFTLERVSQKLFPSSDPNYVRAAINSLVDNGEVERFENPRNGHVIYRFM